MRLGSPVGTLIRRRTLGPGSAGRGAIDGLNVHIFDMAYLHVHVARPTEPVVYPSAPTLVHERGPLMLRLRLGILPRQWGPYD